VAIGLDGLHAKAAGRRFGQTPDVGGEAGVAGAFQVRLRPSTSLVSVPSRGRYWTDDVGRAVADADDVHRPP